MEFYYGKGGSVFKEDAAPRTLKNEIFDWIEVLVASVIIVVLLFTFVFKVVTIEGVSMMDTLLDGEKVIISNIGYTPERGDIVVISRNTDNSLEVDKSSEPIIKRVIATAGQTVDIDYSAGIVYVDGVALKEDYTRTLTTIRHSGDIPLPVRIPDNCIFVMGDNRNDSLDSRSSYIGENGMIDKRYVLGKAVIRVLPFNKFGKINAVPKTADN